MNIELQTKLSQFLKANIIKAEQWAKVLWVHIKGKRPTFVSLAKFFDFVVKSVKKLEPITWILSAQSRKQEQAHKWLAKITGTSKQYGLEREFLDPTRTTWGKHGVSKAEWDLVEEGYYQDSDKDYFRIYFEDGELWSENLTWDQVYNAFNVVPRAYR
jgi:hypothetical protein